MLLSSFGSMKSVWWKYYRMAGYSALSILRSIHPEHHSFKLSDVLHVSLSLPFLSCVPMTAPGLMSTVLVKDTRTVFQVASYPTKCRTVSNQPVTSLASLGRCSFSSVAAPRISSAGRDTSMHTMMMHF